MYLKLIIAIISLGSLFWSNIAWLLFILFLLIVINLRRLIEVKSLKFWAVFLLFSLLPAVMLRSEAAFYFSAFIFCRSVILYLALMLLATSIPANFAERNLPKIVGKRLAVTLALAFNLVPIIRHLLIKNYNCYYFRKVNNYPRHKIIINYVLAVFRQILQAANACAENMLLTDQVKAPQIFIISGPKHSGKTTLLAQLITTFQERHWPVSGILAPSTIQHNRRSTIFVKDIASKRKFLLASRDAVITDVFYEYGGFNFSRQGYEFAKQALNNFIPHGIVALDEYGPLEFAGLGYAKEFERLLTANVAAIFIVVREELLSRFTVKYPSLFYEIIRVPVPECATQSTDLAAEPRS